MKIDLRFLLILITSVFGFCANAQLNGIYTFANVTTLTGSTDPTPVPTSAGITYGVFANFPSTNNSNAATRFSSANWPVGATDQSNVFTGSIDVNRYYTVTLTPILGFSIDLNNITFSFQRSGTGVRQCAVRSSLDNFTTNLPAGANVVSASLSINVDNTIQTADITNIPVQPMINLGSAFDFITAPITFRFYGINAEGSTGSFSIDNVVFNGSASVTWTSSWSNGSGPVAAVDASIQGSFSTATNGTFTAKNITIDTGGALTINSNTNVTLTGSATNNLTSDKFVVESNANLIQTNVATNSGNITVNRNVDLQRLDYVYWSSPVTGTQTLAGFSPLTLPNRFYTFNEASNGFVAASSTSTFAQGRGYAVRAPDTFAASSTTQFVGGFQGVANNGNFGVNVTATANANVGYNLIGNPYPSTVSGNAFLTANSGSLNFWTHTSRTAGLNNYAIYTLAGGTAAAAGGAAPNGFIQVGQGFMFIPSQAAPYSGTATFTNAMRVANNANQFFRTNNQMQNNDSQNRFWLNLTGNDEAFSQILIGYFNNATAGFDGSFDAKQTNTGNTLLYSLIGSEPMAIQAKGSFMSDDKVYLGFKATVAGNYTFAIDHLEGNFALNQAVFIKDNLTGIVHDIKSNPYQFVSLAGTFNNRFEVVYESALSNAGNVFDANSVVVFNNNNVLNVNALTGLKAVKVFDVRGREIFEKLNINTPSTELSLLPQQQVLLVQITNVDGLVVTKKVIF